MNAILALDIDGVMNRLARAGAPGAPRVLGVPDQDGWENRTVEVLVKDVPHSPFHRRQTEDVPAWPVTVAPTLHAPWLRSWQDRGVEIVWATTWEAQANICFAPIYGLGHLPVACSVLTCSPLPEESTPDWKARCLQAYAQDRPLLWIDDMCWDYEARTMEGVEDAESLWDVGFMPEPYWGPRHAAITTIAREGLTAAIMARADQFLARWA